MTGCVLVTGASMGIGLELARCFAPEGRPVVLVARSVDRLEALAAELASAGGRAEVIAADLARPGAAREVLAELERRGLEVEVLVNNAGLGDCGLFHELDETRALDQVQVNVAALVQLCRLVLPRMIARGRGGILNVASIAAFQPGPRMAVYCATKAFVLSFSEALSHELRGTGVHVTCHCPGATATGFGASAGNGRTLLFQAGVADAASVARHAHRAFSRRRLLAVPGLLNRLATLGAQLAPRAWVRWVAARLNT
jgi:short-subunit dehydrogenase